MQKHKIILKGLHIHANHGVMEQERTVGGDFTIDLEITTDFSAAIQTDDLNGTISYAQVYEIVKKEMAQPSLLLEHVGGRITKAIFAEIPQATAIRLRLMKDNPPLGADCEGMGIEIAEDR